MFRWRVTPDLLWDTNSNDHRSLNCVPLTYIVITLPTKESGFFLDSLSSIVFSTEGRYSAVIDLL